MDAIKIQFNSIQFNSMNSLKKPNAPILRLE